MGKHAVALFALFAAAAWAQDASRVYHFNNIKTPSGCQQVANVIRSIGDIRDAAVEPSAATLTTSGTPDQMALTDWIWPELDQAPSASAPAPHTYQMTDPPGVVRVFHFAHVRAPYEIQEIVNVVRTGADINRTFPLPESGTIVVRGTADQVGVAEWLISQLDVTGPTPGAPTQAHQFPGVRDPEVRVVHLAHTTSPVGLQELTKVP